MANKNKTSKSVTKRIRVTRQGKLVRRLMGIDHFKTTKTKKNRRQKRRPASLNYPARKILNY
ncbi:MAG: 50S ribosomal protein L35 [Patescibacteria group bacterium]